MWRMKSTYIQRNTDTGAYGPKGSIHRLYTALLASCTVSSADLATSCVTEILVRLRDANTDHGISPMTISQPRQSNRLSFEGEPS